MADYQIGILREKDLRKWWPDIEEVLTNDPPPTWLRNVPTNDILEMALNGGIDIWAAGTDVEFQLLLITRVIESFENRVLKIEFAYGKNLDELLPQLAAMLDLCAQVHACSEVVVVGREGWRKKLAPLGYKFQGVVLSKPVTKERIH